MHRDCFCILFLPTTHSCYINMLPWNDFDESTALSCDSGFDSADEASSSSTTPIFSLDVNTWTECSDIFSPIGCSSALQFVQDSLAGIQSIDATRVKSSTVQLFHICRLGFTDLVINHNPRIFDLLRAVITIFDISKDPELTHGLSGIFYYLTEHDNSIETMHVESILSVVVKLLSIPLESSLNYTVSGLHNLLDNRILRDKLRTPPIITLLVQILWTCFLFDKSFHPPTATNPYLAFASSTLLSKFVSILCDSLYLLAHRNEIAKRLIHAKRGIIPLLYFAHTYPFEKLQSTCARLLRILSTHPQTKKDILKNDPNLEFFKRFAVSTSRGLSLNAFWTLRNLSDECGNISPLQLKETSEILLMRLRDLEQSNWNSNCLVNEDLQEVYAIGSCISGTLSNFTCRNPFVKTNLVQVSCWHNYYFKLWCFNPNYATGLRLVMPTQNRVLS